MREQLSRMYQQASAEFASNPRLRIGVWAVLGIFLLYGVLVMADMRAERADNISNLARQADRTASVLEAADWHDKAEQAKNRLEAVQGRFWEADSRGIARAELENWLDARAEQADMERVNIEVASAAPVDDEPELWRVSARVEGNHNPRVLRRWLAELAAAEHMLAIERFESRAANPGRTRTWVNAWFRIADERAADNGGEG